MIKLNSSDSLNVEFSVEVCGMFQTDTTVSSTLFQRILIPGCGRFTISGYPEMPYIRQLIAIPECDSLILQIVVKDSTTTDEYYVYPAPEYQKVTGQDSTVYLIEVFERGQVTSPRKVATRFGCS